jgi:hypothetical protein
VFDGGEHAYNPRVRAHEGTFNPNKPVPQPGDPAGVFAVLHVDAGWRAMLGFAEQFKFLASPTTPTSMRPAVAWLRRRPGELRAGGPRDVDHYTSRRHRRGRHPVHDGAGPAAPEGCRDRPADPFNDHEPVDSSAPRSRLSSCASGATGEEGDRYTDAGLAVARTLLAPPYLSEDESHQGLLLHSVYHRPNGWDFVPSGRKVPCGESSMWGDYHLLELALLIRRMAGGKYYTFFDVPQ